MTCGIYQIVNQVNGKSYILHSAGYLGQKIIIAGGSAKKPQN